MAMIQFISNFRGGIDWVEVFKFFHEMDDESVLSWSHIDYLFMKKCIVSLKGRDKLDIKIQGLIFIVLNISRMLTFITIFFPLGLL